MNFTKKDFIKNIENHKYIDIKTNGLIENISDGNCIYSEFIQELEQNNWIRFAPGYKAGVYGHPTHQYCIKLLGMGVGEDPKFFCGKGEYIEHERNMMLKFHESFNFLPDVKTQEWSIRFLVDHCNISIQQAEFRCLNNDLLITELVKGIPFATQTGQFLNYSLNIGDFSNEVIFEMEASLYKLKEQLESANRKGLLHNDPMPPNIIFSIDDENRIVAKLVDFELSQDLKQPSPLFVNNTVKELYKERDVPLNIQTGKYKKNLDQHLLDLSIEFLQKLPSHIKKHESIESIWDSISVTIPFIGVGINIGGLKKQLKKIHAL